MKPATIVRVGVLLLMICGGMVGVIVYNTTDPDSPRFVQFVSSQEVLTRAGSLSTSFARPDRARFWSPGDAVAVRLAVNCSGLFQPQPKFSFVQEIWSRRPDLNG